MGTPFESFTLLDPLGPRPPDGITTAVGGVAAFLVAQNRTAADMTVEVMQGQVCCQGILATNNDPHSLTIATADPTLARIDTVIARIGHSPPAAELEVLTGTPAAVPVAPTLTQNDLVYEVQIANVAVAALATTIVNANITDQRAWSGIAGVSVAPASSATAINYTVYPDSPNIVVLPVTGTTNILSIPPAPAGTILLLVFANDDVAVTEFFQGNITLRGGVYLSAAGGAITLVSDGVGWSEVCRGEEWASAHCFLGNPTGARGAAFYTTLGFADLPAPGSPGNSAVGDVAADGVATTFPRSDHKHGRESFATPAIVLGSAVAAGSATTPIRSDSTIAAFDATNPSTQAFGDAAVVGTAAFAARRDHKHAMMANPGAWTTWTPGTTTQGVTPTQSNQCFRVFTYGKLVVVEFFATFTSGGTANTAILCNLPVGLTVANTIFVDQGVGSGLFKIAASGTYIVLTVNVRTTTQFGFVQTNGVGLVGTTAGGGPQIATGDILTWTAQYETV